MKDKYDYMQGFNVDSKADIAKTLAVFGAFTEGLQLFASFAMLMNFPRFNKMKGMGQIVTWSVRDETLHCLSIIRLFRTFVQENPEIWTEELKREIYLTCATIVDHEDASRSRNIVVMNFNCRRAILEGIVSAVHWPWKLAGFAQREHRGALGRNLGDRGRGGKWAKRTRASHRRTAQGDVGSDDDLRT